MSVITLKGIHGTCATFAQEIYDTDEFNPSKTGRMGKGVYFWQYYTDSSFAEELAWRWADSQLNTYVYARVADPKCAIVYADIQVDEDEVLNFSTGVHRENITMIISNTIEDFRNVNRKQIENATNYTKRKKWQDQEEVKVTEKVAEFVEYMRIEDGIDFKVIISNISIPDGRDFKVKEKMPICAYIGEVGESIVVLDPTLINLEEVHYDEET